MSYHSYGQFTILAPAPAPEPMLVQSNLQQIQVEPTAHRAVPVEPTSYRAPPVPSEPLPPAPAQLSTGTAIPGVIQTAPGTTFAPPEGYDDATLCAAAGGQYNAAMIPPCVFGYNRKPTAGVGTAAVVGAGLLAALMLLR